jgi:hypothetical protein
MAFSSHALLLPTRLKRLVSSIHVDPGLKEPRRALPGRVSCLVCGRLLRDPRHDPCGPLAACRAQRTLEIWGFAIQFAFKYFLLGQKWTYGKQGMEKEPMSARKKVCVSVSFISAACCALLHPGPARVTRCSDSGAAIARHPRLDVIWRPNPGCVHCDRRSWPSGCEMAWCAWAPRSLRLDSR